MTTPRGMEQITTRVASGTVTRVVIRGVAVLVLWVLLVALSPGSASAADRWSDISDADWEADYGVSATLVATVAAGFEDGAFRPSLPVTRGQFAKMAVGGLGLAALGPDAPTFSDVRGGDSLFPFVEGAFAAGLVAGYGDGSFRPGAPLRRQQAFSILARYLSGEEVAGTGHISGAHADHPSLEAWYAMEGSTVTPAFADWGVVAEVHAPAVAYLVDRGVLKGSVRSGGAYIDPLGPLTRAQAVVLIIRTAEAGAAPARSIDPLVSTAWLNEELGAAGLTVLDLRGPADYAAGHIPGSLSAPFGTDSVWARPQGGLAVELPVQPDLVGVISGYGLTKQSRVVLVGGISAAGYPQVDATRVAVTLVTAGIRNVAILQGGYRAWKGEGRPVSTESAMAEPSSYSGRLRADVIVTTDYVRAQIGSATIVDTRSADIYSGAVIDPAAPKPGHIPTARSLPVQSAWRNDGTYAPRESLALMAAGALGADKDRRIIVYCTYGGTASVWWFVLSQVLGYRDVRLYDGSAQAWVLTDDMVIGAATE